MVRRVQTSTGPRAAVTRPDRLHPVARFRPFFHPVSFGFRFPSILGLGHRGSAHGRGTCIALPYSIMTAPRPAVNSAPRRQTRGFGAPPHETAHSHPAEGSNTRQAMRAPERGRPLSAAGGTAIVSHSNVPVAQLDRASASGAEGYRFNSCRAYWKNKSKAKKTQTEIEEYPRIPPTNSHPPRNRTARQNPRFCRAASFHVGSLRDENTRHPFEQFFRVKRLPCVAVVLPGRLRVNAQGFSGLVN